MRQAWVIEGKYGEELLIVESTIVNTVLLRLGKEGIYITKEQFETLADLRWSIRFEKEESDDRSQERNL